MNIFNLFTSRYTQNQTSNAGVRKQEKNAADASREIDKSRFESVMVKRGIPSHVIETLFKTMDVNGDGKINGNDFQRVLQMHAQSVRQTETSKSKTETEPVKKAAVNNAPPPETKQTPVNPQTNSRQKEYSVPAAAKKIFTYTRNGSPYFYPVSTFVNALV